MSGNRKILVTGGAGFIGAHLCEKLLEEGYEVRCLDNLYRFDSSKIDHMIGRENFEFVEADIRDRETVSEEMKDIDVVMHLAAQSDVQGSMDNKDFSFETNVVGTWNLLREAEEQEVERFIFASSREAYGDAQTEPVSEDHPLEPKNFYGASKASAEQYVQQFQNHTGLETVRLRLANVYGPGDRDRVIPIFLEKAMNDEPLELYGGSQVLDFVWIEDVVECFLKTLEDDFPYSVMNVGSGEGTSVRELAELIVEITGSNSQIVEKKNRDYETDKFVAGTERINEIIDRTMKLEQGIQRMIGV